MSRGSFILQFRMSMLDSKAECCVFPSMRGTTGSHDTFNVSRKLRTVPIDVSSMDGSSVQ